MLEDHWCRIHGHARVILRLRLRKLTCWSIFPFPWLYHDPMLFIYAIEMLETVGFLYSSQFNVTMIVVDVDKTESGQYIKCMLANLYDNMNFLDFLEHEGDSYY